MDISITMILFFLLFLPFKYIAGSCSITRCGNSNFPISFPFQLQLQGQKQPRSCGYPGFNLNCNHQGITFVNLPYLGEFCVRNISYVEQQIQLYDPDDCLPRRLLLPMGLNLSGSPFFPVFIQNFTFLTCPSEVVTSRFAVIGCLSDSKESFLATASMSFAKSMSTASCKIISTLRVPVPKPVQPEELSFDLHGDLLLTWGQPDCRACELQGGVCGYKNNASQEISCFYNNIDGSSKAVRIIRYVTLFMSLSILACTFGIGCSTFFMRRRIGPLDVQQNSPAASTAPPQSAVVVGLDESTIESYEKLVLGESRRLPGPNDTTCPICLSEYRTKDTVRCIPECQHCFHTDCVDKWLQMNTTCPVCRNSPSPPHLGSNSNIRYALRPS